MNILKKVVKIFAKVRFEYHNKRHFFHPFGAFWYSLCPFLKKYGSARHKAILSALSKMDGIKTTIDEYCDYRKNDFSEIAKDCPIWVMWWQGFDNCPPIVEKCVASIKRNAGKHPVIFLTKNNYKQYVDISVAIEEKILKMNCIAYISDIVRFGLLSTKGGIWLDATIYVSKPIEAWSCSLYSIRHSSKDPRYVLEGYRWSSFMVAAAPHEVMPTFVYKALLAYFTENDALIDYFLTDYLIATIYLKNEYVREQIDSLPADNYGALELLMNLDKPYDKEELCGMLNARRFHKLDWRHCMTNDYSMLAHLK